MLALAGLPLDDVQQIFVVLAVLYAVECCWWLRGETRRLFARPFAAWSDPPGDRPAASGWRLSFANPLPWTGSFAAEPFPLPFDDARLLLPVLDPATGRERYSALDWAALEPVAAVGREVRSGPRVLGAFSSPALAAAVAARIERLRAAAPEERPDEAERALAAIWSLAEASDRLARWRRSARTVRDLGGYLAVTGLVVGPPVYACRGSLPPGLPPAVLLVFGGLWLATAVAGLFLRGPEPETESDRATHRLIAFFSPASAMRLFDTAGRDLLVGHEPLVVALTTAAGGDADSTVAAWLRDALFPAHRPEVAPDDAAAAATLASFRARSATLARRAVADAGLVPESLLAPVSIGPNVRSYCPRCGRQFTVAGGTCEACGIALVVLPGR